jgi:hypothetical protein
MTVSRETVEGFIQRTRTNLELIEENYKTKSEAHVITQLVNSLLGILVFPWKLHTLKDLEDEKMSNLNLQEWPERIVKTGKDESIGEFMSHMRNAVAHRKITFSSDSPNPEEVILTFNSRDYKHKIDWEASFNGSQLRQFCNKFMDLIEKRVG